VTGKTSHDLTSPEVTWEEGGGVGGAAGKCASRNGEVPGTD